MRFARGEGSHLLRKAKHDVVVLCSFTRLIVSLACCGLAYLAWVALPKLSEATLNGDEYILFISKVIYSKVMGVPIWHRGLFHFGTGGVPIWDRG